MAYTQCSIHNRTYTPEVPAEQLLKLQLRYTEQLTAEVVEQPVKEGLTQDTTEGVIKELIALYYKEGETAPTRTKIALLTSLLQAEKAKEEADLWKPLEHTEGGEK